MIKTVNCEIGEIIVSLDITNKKARAVGYGLKNMDDATIFNSFHASGLVGHNGDLVSNGNDITTNYLEVAMVKVMQSEGIEVNDIRPYPVNRVFSILELQEINRRLGSKEVKPQ